jgi:single-strand DNA-binding protein
MADSTVTLVGNLTRDPELKFTQTGKAQTRFSIAVNRRWQKDGNWEEQTSYFDVTCWAVLAENVANQVTKGTRVIVSGRIEQRSWETKEGDKRSTIEIIADAVGIDLSKSAGNVTRSATLIAEDAF